MKEYIYYVKGLDEVLSVWAYSVNDAIQKIRDEWDLQNWTPKVLER